MAKGRARKCEILVINNIAQIGLKRLPAELYAVVKEAKDPQAILVRSQDLHKYEFGPSLRAVGRAGAGVNNIPVGALSKRGVPVFNAPGGQRQRGEGAGARRHADRGAQPRAGAGIRAQARKPTISRRASRTARSSLPARSCRAIRWA